MMDYVKPSPGKFKSRSASVASGAFIDGKTNEIFFSIFQLKPHMQVVHSWYLFKLTVTTLYQAVMQPLGFLQLTDFPLCHAVQIG